MAVPTPIECPEFIELGSFKFKYSECNDYQKRILVLAQEVKKYNEMTKANDKEISLHKKLGVIEFLCGRMDAYRGIVKVSHNMYEGPAKEDPTP